MPRHDVKRKRYQKFVHEQASKGLVNDASGKFTQPTSSRRHDGEVYAAKAAKNRERNKRNAAAKATRKQRMWQRAEDKARAVLQHEGDTSTPLPEFVRSFLKDNQPKRRRW